MVQDQWSADAQRSNRRTKILIAVVVVVFLCMGWYATSKAQSITCPGAVTFTCAGSPAPTPTPTPTPAPTPTPTLSPGTDPGFNTTGHTWTGLWVPPTLPDGSPNPGYGTATPTLVVVDPSGPQGAGARTIVPGCVNQGDEAYSAPCNTAGTVAGVDSVTGTPINFAFGAGRIMAVRYWSNTGTAAYYQLYDNQGGSASSSVVTSLSLKPGDFNVPAVCKMANSSNPYVTYGPSASYCNPPYSVNSPYYINISVPVGCSGVHCAFTILESAGLQ